LKKKFIQLLLLFSLFFNVAHASIIAIEDDCHHETAHEYVLEQSQSSECGDLCDMHHCFHFLAILDTQTITCNKNHGQESLIHKNNRYTPPFQKTIIKPPIA